MTFPSSTTSMPLSTWVVWRSVVWCCVVWRGGVWCGVAWCVVVWVGGSDVRDQDIVIEVIRYNVVIV